MIRRCPLVCSRMIRGLSRESGDQPLSIEAAKQCAHSLQTEGFEVPRWEDLAEGLRPPMPLMEEGDIFQPKGCQHCASKSTDKAFVRVRLAPSLSEVERAMLRSQGGPLAACPFTCAPNIEVVSLRSHSESCCCDDCNYLSLIQHGFAVDERFKRPGHRLQRNGQQEVGGGC